MAFKFYKNDYWVIGDHKSQILNLHEKQIVVKYSGDNFISLLYGEISLFKGNVTTIEKNDDGDFYVDYAEFMTVYLQYSHEEMLTIVSTLTTMETNIKTKLDTINTTLQNSGGTTLKAFTQQITRTAPTTAYTAGQVIADVSAAFVPFTNVAKANGTGVKINRVRLQTSDTGFAGKKFNIHLYKEAPTFIADYGTFAISYANATKRLGVIPVVLGTGTLGTVGMNDWNSIICNPTARDIYYIIECVDGGTPTASSQWQLTLDCELSNQ